mmetsp:Transcript_157/g.282  ORF Transcript_157/g.282 Transcript_157/m.282 type:complete len:81 (-) Transcript_157:642-884(-)
MAHGEVTFAVVANFLTTGPPKVGIAASVPIDSNGAQLSRGQSVRGGKVDGDPWCEYFNVATRAFHLGLEFCWKGYSDENR